MSPETHLFASWLIAAKTTRNLRDCRLVALAGILPDADGLGLVVDWITNARGGVQTALYPEYHHFLLHGAFGAVLIAATMAAFAQDRWRVAWLALFTFHLHLVCDLIGSRGPSPQDLWPIFYFGPFTHKPMLLWRGQWRLDGWKIRYFSSLIFLWPFGFERNAAIPLWEFSIVAWTTSSVQCFENGVRLWCFAYAVGHARSRSRRKREKMNDRDQLDPDGF